MTGKTIRRYQMLVRVSRFGMERAAAFLPHTIGARAFADVEAAAGALERHGLAQASARVPANVHPKEDARGRLRGALRAIGRTARALAIESPGLERRFRVPKSNGDQALLAAARAVVREASEMANAFVEHGLAPTFLDDLTAAIDALERAGNDYDAVKRAGVAASAGVDAILAQTVAPVLRLDVIVNNVFRDDTPTLAVWRQARRVGQGRRSAMPESAGAAAPIRLVADVA